MDAKLEEATTSQQIDVDVAVLKDVRKPHPFISLPYNKKIQVN